MILVKFHQHQSKFMYTQSSQYILNKKLNFFFKFIEHWHSINIKSFDEEDEKKITVQHVDCGKRFDNQHFKIKIENW